LLLRQRLLLRLVGSARVHEVGSETRFIGALALLCSKLLRLLLLRRELGLPIWLPVSRLRLWAGLARHTGGSKSVRSIGCSGSLLRERCMREPRISRERGICGGERRLLLLFLAFGLKLVLQVLHVVVRIVLEHRLWRLPLRRLLCRRFLPGGAEDRRNDHQERRSEIYEGLEVLFENPLWLVLHVP
jgi:hypothetical protein